MRGSWATSSGKRRTGSANERGAAAVVEEFLRRREMRGGVHHGPVGDQLADDVVCRVPDSGPITGKAADRFRRLLMLGPPKHLGCSHR
jgi:hypothetical protein